MKSFPVLCAASESEHQGRRFDRDLAKLLARRSVAMERHLLQTTLAASRSSRFSFAGSSVLPKRWGVSFMFGR